MSEYIAIKSAYIRNDRYYSQASQDKFIANLFEFKHDGHFVDIGSCPPESNSTYLDVCLDWSGICIDMKPGDYSMRKHTKVYQDDATLINYKEEFRKNNLPNVIEYLSVDVDSATNSVLKILPFDDYTYSAITIEHDFYAEGENRRVEQRKILSDTGYHLLCSNVWFLNPLSPIENQYFEDWWINPKSFDIEKYKFLEGDKQNVNDIIAKFNK